jgi:hypothetical protein
MNYVYELQSKIYNPDTDEVTHIWVYAPYRLKRGSANDNFETFVGTELKLREFLRSLS